MGSGPRAQRSTSGCLDFVTSDKALLSAMLESSVSPWDFPMLYR